jgi:predicted membrane protein
METKPTTTDRRLVAGLLLVIAGGLLMLDKLNLLPFNLSYYLISWKTLLIGIGIIILSSRENRTTGWIFIGLGLILWLPDLVNYPIRLSTIFWPALLIGIGLIILSNKGGKNPSGSKAHIFSASKMPNENAEDYLDETAIFGGGNSRFISNNLRGGKITAIFGGSDLDLKNATPSPDGCVIDALVIFGGANMIVPDDWQIKSEVVSIFGGFSDKRIVPSQINPSKYVVIKGVALFGGIELKTY